MPRSRGGGGGAPRRPAAPPPPPPRPAQQQTRPASTAAHPPQTQQPPMNAQAQQGRSPGLFGQMASTAAGVAVGSSIGHAVGGWFGGSSTPSSSAEQDGLAEQQYGANQYGMTQQSQGQACAPQVANFRSCMDQNQGDLNICGWYLDQLKACQQAAAQY